MNKQPVITATFVKTRIEDSGSDSVMDYQVYEFSNIVDENGRKFSNKWIKKTALLVKSNLVRGKKYRIKFSRLSIITQRQITKPNWSQFLHI